MRMNNFHFDTDLNIEPKQWKYAMNSAYLMIYTSKNNKLMIIFIVVMTV